MAYLRVRRSVKVAPGVKLTLNKTSVSVTAGKRGAHYTASSNGSRTRSVGVPGTGVSMVDRKRSSRAKTVPPQTPAAPKVKRADAQALTLAGLVMIVLAALILLVGITAHILILTVVGIVWAIVACVIFGLGLLALRASRRES